MAREAERNGPARAAALFAVLLGELGGKLGGLRHHARHALVVARLPQPGDPVVLVLAHLDEAQLPLVVGPGRRLHHRGSGGVLSPLSQEQAFELLILDAEALQLGSRRSNCRDSARRWCDRDW